MSLAVLATSFTGLRTLRRLVNLLKKSNNCVTTHGVDAVSNYENMYELARSLYALNHV